MSTAVLVALGILGAFLACLAVFPKFRKWWGLENARGVGDLVLKLVGGIAALAALDFFVLNPRFEQTVELVDTFDARAVDEYYRSLGLTQPGGIADTAREMDEYVDALGSVVFEPGYSAYGVELEDRPILCDVAGPEFQQRFEINDCAQGNAPFGTFPSFGASDLYPSGEPVPIFHGIPEFAWHLLEMNVRGADIVVALDAFASAYGTEARVLVTNVGPGRGVDVVAIIDPDSGFTPRGTDPIDLSPGQAHTFVFDGPPQRDVPESSVFTRLPPRVDVTSARGIVDRTSIAYLLFVAFAITVVTIYFDVKVDSKT